MIMGWFYGPIVGIFLGAVSDTLCYFIASGGIWFWMYAIQEPIVCFLSGIFAGIYNYRVRLDKKSVTFDLIFNQITIFIFGIFSYVILLF